MTLVMKSDAYGRGEPLAASMHRDRKHIFVDVLHWDVPVIAGEYEVDQFDTTSAVYLIAGKDEDHHGSLRLLPTTQPHILGSLFPELCDGPVPAGSNIYEITRCCFSPRLPAAERRQVRNQLATAAVEFALFNNIDAYTCVADGHWYHQILAMGWMCEPLGLPRMLGSDMTGALKINITPETQRLLFEAGVYARTTLQLATPTLLAA